MTILITRPRHDKATNYLYFWSQPVADFAGKKNMRLIDLSGEKANSLLVRQYNRNIKPTLLFLNGHGTEDIIAGHDDQPLISAAEDLTDFAGSVFYCRSCDSAVILGVKLVENGAKGFIGYRQKFIFGYIPQYMTKPLKDPLAKLFLDPSNLIPISLMKGHTSGTTYQKSQVAMRTNFHKMLSSAASFEERYYAQFLWSNIKHQTLLGDPQARI